MTEDDLGASPWSRRSSVAETGRISDLVIVEIAGSVAGAHAAKLFGDLGATVVCLEPDAGSELRSDPAVWAAFATSRTALTLGSPEAADWLRRADVIIESSGSAPLATSGPATSDRTVRLRISPFGSDGPYAEWTGADIVDQAISGHLYLSGRPDREPLQGPSGQAALAAGVFGAIGALAALHSRRNNGASGSGQSVEVTHHEALASLHQFTDVRFTHAGNVLKRMGNRYAGPGSPIGMYRAADGSMALTVATAAHGEILLALTGLDDLLNLPGIDSITDLMVNAALFEPAFEGWLGTQMVGETVELFQSARLAAGPVLNMRQVLRDAHLEERDWWTTTEVDGGAVRLPGPPFRIDSVPWNARPAPPLSPSPSSARSSTEADLVLNETGSEAVQGYAGNDLSASARLGQSATAHVESSVDSAVGSPLSGLRVLDLTRVWAGPLAARILGELGADVVMLEAPWARTPLVMPESYVKASHFFPADDPLPNPWNRQGFVNKYAVTKRSVCVDIATEEGQMVLARLLPHVDVLIENYSPRVMPNLGFTEERMREINPDLIYVTMPGYGRSGPAKDYSAYGPVLDSHAGLSTLMGYPEAEAWKCGIAWPDPVAGIHAAFAVLAALWERSEARSGTTIEVAQFETAVSMIADRLIRAQIDDADPIILGNRHPIHAPHGVYPAAGDDCWLAVAVLDDVSWRALCEHIELPDDWMAWTRSDRHANHDEIDAALTSWSCQREPAASAAMLQRIQVAAAPVADAAMLINDPHLRARGYYTDVTHPEAGTHAWGPTCAARLSRTPANIERPAPCLGQHNREILQGWAGYTESEIDALREAGVIADRPPS